MEDDDIKQARAFAEQYIALGIEQAAKDGQSVHTSIFALLETISWFVKQEQPDQPIDEFEDYVSYFLEDWRNQNNEP